MADPEASDDGVRYSPSPEAKPMPEPQKSSAVPTYTECMANAARLLEFAEGETDLAKMSQYNELAQTWVNLASLHQDALT